MGNGSQQQQLGAQEGRVVKGMFDEIAKLKESHADYFAWFEDVDPGSAPRQDIVDLMTAAPSDAVKFYLFGMFTMRLQLAAMTGREFK